MRYDMYKYVPQLLNDISNCTKNICMSSNLQHLFICRIQISYKIMSFKIQRHMSTSVLS